MRNFIELDRRFRVLTEKELEDPEVLAMLNDRRFDSTLAWSDLLELSRVVLLAEAGSGKSWEMEEQVRLLAAAGRPAFFIPLETLKEGPFLDALSPENEKRFAAWMGDGHSTAWFLLDARDELQLTSGKLDSALLRLRKAIDGHLDRARIIISSRPSDWRFQSDTETFRRQLPLPQSPTVPPPLPDPDEFFLRSLSRDIGDIEVGDGIAKVVKANRPRNDEAKGVDIRTVILLPMSGQQIELFVQHSGAADAAALMAEIDRSNAWVFARRPLDLEALITTWEPSTRQLGTRAQQHEANVVAKLKDRPDRQDRDILADDHARLGAEWLALALALTRTRTIRSPEQSLDPQRAEGVLDPALVLRNGWTDAQRQALLRRALFDPATYGRIRFHHRSVQEYLAARRLKALREKGMPTKALLRLLFAELYGERVVIPSMRPIAAWLALWDEPVVRQELIRREPEALLSLGDPESLSVSVRAELLRVFVGAYGSGGSLYLHIPIDEVRRLADPDLAPTVRELWGSGPSNTDVRELLIEVIRQGAIVECADLAKAAAVETSWDWHIRVLATRALLKTGQEEKVREITRGLLEEPTAWPMEYVRSLVDDLYPKFIATEGLMAIVEHFSDSENSDGELEWALGVIVDQLAPTSNLAIEFRDELADLIWGGRGAAQSSHQIVGRFEKLAPALAKLCVRQLEISPREIGVLLVRASVVAFRFCHDINVEDKPRGRLRDFFRGRSEHRGSAFWADFAVMKELGLVQATCACLHDLTEDGLVGRLADADRVWLEATFVDEALLEGRPIALLALLQLWSQRGKNASEVASLRSLLMGDQALEAILVQGTTTRERDPEMEQMRRESAQRQLEHKERQAGLREDWTKWREEILANSDQAFSAEKARATIQNVYTRLKALRRSSNHYNAWDDYSLEQMFGSDFARRAALAFQAFWRRNTPVLWSDRSPEERGSTLWAWIHGLCGVASEASLPSWTSRLTKDEARIAAAYAAIEINGFAGFLVDLVSAFPAEVDEVLGRELSAELAVGPEHDHLPVLSTLVNANTSVKQLLAPRLIEALNTWPRSHTSETARDRPHQLGHVLRILDEVATGPTRVVIARICAQQYETEPFVTLAPAWLRGLFRFDSLQGAESMSAMLSPLDDAAVREHAIELFAELFGDRHDAIAFEINDPARRARALKSLVMTAFACIRHEDDLVHEGIHSISTRDEAERARGVLLSALLDTPGPAAHLAIVDLSRQPCFAHFSARLRLLARRRAAAEAEPKACSSDDILKLGANYELPPHDRDTLFTVMHDRLEDLAHDIAHDDFSNRRTLRTITEEIEIQRTLAAELRSRANGAYAIEREGEVADKKTVDIRFLAVNGSQKSVVEIKVADKRWSVTDFERALRQQLVGQYLRHETCRAGILLLSYNGDKKDWEHPTTKARLDFEGVLTYLRARAQEIEIEHQHHIRVGVFGLDLRDPHLEPAHRK